MEVAQLPQLCARSTWRIIDGVMAMVMATDRRQPASNVGLSRVKRETGETTMEAQGGRMRIKVPYPWIASICPLGVSACRNQHRHPSVP